MKETEVKQIVRENYAKVATLGLSCCGSSNSCCSGGSSGSRDLSRGVGYTDTEMDLVPEGANLGLGCGNPVALASLKEGETVIDLGSGAGFDCFLAATRVGPAGRVIGVDMTPEMVTRARQNAENSTHTNVEFRLGEIENLPVADNTADIIISNCVINLAPDKQRVFREAFRALKPGGRVMVSDIVLIKALPQAVLESAAAYAGCIAGAVLLDEYLAAMDAAGFIQVKLVDDAAFTAQSIDNDPIAHFILDNLKLTREQAIEVISAIRSIKIAAVKPA